MKILILECTHSNERIVFRPQFVGHDNITIYLPAWAKEVTIIRDETPVEATYTIYATDGKEVLQ